MSDLAEAQFYCSRCLTAFTGELDECPNLACRRKRASDGWGRIYGHGEIFDRTYRIHKMLAVGGAGVTYIARELDAEGEETGPRLALKVLLAARDQGPYVRRLATEAQIIQELDHPNIVHYLGFVHRTGHSPYLITRFESGGSLLDHMRRIGTLSVKEAAVVGRQICWALEKGHERGIVHRDLKPENVLLARIVPKGEDPVIRVADFGIAKVRGSIGSGITRVGAFVGTPHYAAPEQFVGGAVSEMADVYGVGALLFFCMTARHVIRFADRLDPDDSFQLLCDALPPVVRRDQDPPEDVARINKVLGVAMGLDPLTRCTIVELDKMLEAILADREPERPARAADPAAAETGLVSATSSVVGVAAALQGAATEKPREPVAATEPANTVESDATLGVRATAIPVPVATPEAELPAPVQAAPSQAPPAPRAPVAPSGEPPGSDSGGGGLALVAGLFFFLLVLAGGGGFWLLRDQLGFGADPDEDDPVVEARVRHPIELTGKESDAAMRADHSLIVKSLDNLGEWLEGVCDVPSGARVSLKVVIEADGSVRSADTETDGDVAECVARKVGLADFNRSGDRAARVRHTLRW